MVRIKGSGHNGGSGRGGPNDGYLRHLENHTASTLVEAKTYPCTTKLVGNTSLAQTDKKSTPSNESTSLLRKIDAYMDVRSFIENVRSTPFGARTGKEVVAVERDKR
ncbi:hypothetical protein J1N35_023009 [Gossypium stocksii]|uniref:Uncharacterized protein n=1 Tax=Gossypium stocksii TaxID=47602 RepID=A0A9D3VHQ2_9ROSI|nr:hypothetical protein J1N35_023009 [Gossypium stocksii]